MIASASNGHVLPQGTIDVGLSASAFDALGYPVGDPNRPQDLALL